MKSLLVTCKQEVTLRLTPESSTSIPRSSARWALHAAALPPPDWAPRMISFASLSASASLIRDLSLSSFVVYRPSCW